MKVELAAVFDSLQPAALARAATFIIGWPELFGANVQVDLAYHPKRRALVGVVRAEQPSHDARWRFAFWCAHLGARSLTPAALAEDQRSAFMKLLADCPMRAAKVEQPQLAAAMKKLLGADEPASLNPGGGLVLELALGGGSAGEPTVVLDGNRYSIHVPYLHAPPMNDRVRVALLLLGERHLADGVVTSVVRPANAGPTRPAGFVVRVDASPKVAAALKATFTRASVPPPAGGALADDPRRTDARIPMRAPVKVAAPTRVARAAYETDEALLAVAAYLDEGRLPVESTVRPPIGTAFTLELCLPGGDVARAAAVVAAHEDAAIVVTFTLEDDGEAKLAAALARARARARAIASPATTAERSAPRAKQEMVPLPPQQQQQREQPKTEVPKEDVTATISYESEEALAADYVENLSKGGAFIKTETPAAMDTMVTLDIQLPSGAALKTLARVVWIGNGGMGVQFQLDAHARDALDAILERIATPPRRALVVLANAALATEVAAGLAASSFHVLRADGKDGGLSTLFDELLDLDLLVVDAVAQEGRSIVDIVRAAGEADLPIVALGAGPSRADVTVDPLADIATIVTACVNVAARKR